MVARGRIVLLVAALAALLASGTLLAACGGDESIPREDATVLLDRLEEVERGIAEGNCDGPRGAQASADLLREQVGDGELSRVPADLDPEVQELLEAGAARLAQLVEEECVPAEEPIDEVEPEPVEPEEVEPEPVEPEEVEPPEDEGPPDDVPGEGRGPDGDRDGPDGGSDGGPGRGQGGPGGPPTGGIGR